MPRIADTCTTYELRGAEIRTARKPWYCDHPECPEPEIIPGEAFAYVSTGLRFCAYHWTVDDVAP